MSTLPYVLLDVFTDRIFGGNQLAVFVHREPLDPRQMQAIARELNLSETVFAEPIEAGRRWRLRIFTPAMELPFAGHPTVGAAIALDHLGDCDGTHPIAFEEGVGTVDIEFSRRDTGALVATLDSPRIPVQVPAIPEQSQLASLLGLYPNDLGPDAASAWTAGVPYTFIPVVDRATLSSVRFDTQVWRDALSNSDAPHVIAYTFDADANDLVHVRMFAPLMGIPEDPATGAAAAALAGLLADRAGLQDGDFRYHIRQGDDMGRPSGILLSITMEKAAIRRVRVGGEAVIIGRGQLELPE